MLDVEVIPLPHGPCFGSSFMHGMMFSRLSRMPLLEQAQAASEGSWTAIEVFTGKHISDAVDIKEALVSSARDDAGRKRTLDMVISGIGRAAKKTPKHREPVVLGLLEFARLWPCYTPDVLAAAMPLVRTDRAEDEYFLNAFGQFVNQVGADNPFVFGPYVDRLCEIANGTRNHWLLAALGFFAATRVPFGSQIEERVPAAYTEYFGVMDGQHSTARQVANAVTEGKSAANIVEKFFPDLHNRLFSIFFALCKMQVVDASFVRYVVTKAFEEVQSGRRAPFELSRALSMLAFGYPELIPFLAERTHELLVEKMKKRGEVSDPVWRDDGMDPSGSDDIWLASFSDYLYSRGLEEPLSDTFQIGRWTRGAGRIERTLHVGSGRGERDRRYSVWNIAPRILREGERIERELEVRG